MHPITGHGALEGKYRYRSTLSLTLVLDGDGQRRAWSLKPQTIQPVMSHYTNYVIPAHQNH
jgi:hypothetical protein